MAKFIFKMQNILDIKLRLETVAKTEYAENAARLDEEERKARKLIIQMNTYEEEAKKNVTDKVDIIELRRNNDSIKAMKELIKQQAVRVKIAQNNLDRAQMKLNQAMQERKIYEKLKEKAFEDFKIELNDTEKKEIDELVSFIYNNKEKE